MRVRGDNAPSNAFTLEEQPKNPGYALVRFFENPKEFQELELYDGLSEDILGNYAGYLAQAKLAEAEGRTIPMLKQQVSDLEADKTALTEKVANLEGQVTDAQVALCEVYEIALSGASSGGVV